MFFNKQIPLILALIFLCLNSASAATTKWHKSVSNAAETRLISSFYEDAGSKKLIAAIHFKISSGWKICSKDSEGIGMPPNFDFTGSKNYSAHKIYWPQPEFHEEKIGDETFKYSTYQNEVIIPIEIDLQKIDEATELTLALDYSLCKDVCIPVSEKFSLIIPSEIDSASLKEIEKFYSKKFIETSPLLQKEGGATPSPTSSASTDQPESTLSLRLVAYIFFALLGGLILNVMPCVLPVLSIKLLSVIDRPNAQLERIRFAFFSTTLGILFCFLIFALLACTIKFTGNELGWGLQFQNPHFLIFLIIVVTFVTANLMGKFEITFEQVVATFLNKKIDESEKKKNIFVPNFFSGILATLLATPCSAPFLGSAISFALVQNFTIIFVIFFCIGIGFSAPYIILFFAPRLVHLLPKPGMWMIQIKYFLALLMAATVLWLLYILSSNLDLTATILISLMVVAIFFSFKISDKILKYATIILIVGSAFALPGDFHKRHKVSTERAEGLWQTFNEEEIYRQVREGKVVLINVSADWCITCKFNKINVLQSEEIVLLLKRGDIIGMRGDITRPNPEIMEFMRKHNRFAIPFDVVYGPGAPNGLLNSELLNKGELLKLIKQAK